MCRPLIALAVAAMAMPAAAYDRLVEKQVFETADFVTQGGETIAEVRVGWEAYGELNAARDNVVLITHFYSGNSHAAGRYAESDAAPGYWNSIIGPGKAIDTDRFYVISVDSLVNLNTGDPNTVTTGPASIDPATGRPYGLSFPVVQIRDFVEVQRLVLESLGIERLHAVMGASMGALQAYAWAASYPDRVERLIPVIGAGWADADLIAWLNIWSAPIRLDPNWNGGDYYDGEPPLRGLAEALKIVTYHANHWKWANAAFGRNWADEGADPAASLDNRFQVEAVLDNAGMARARVSDANHFLYLARANQLFYAGGGESVREGLMGIRAPTLMIYSDDDLVFPGDAVRETAATIRAGGTPVTLVALSGTRGHLDGVLNIDQAARQIAAFLAE